MTHLDGFGEEGIHVPVPCKGREDLVGTTQIKLSRAPVIDVAVEMLSIEGKVASMGPCRLNIGGKNISLRDIQTDPKAIYCNVSGTNEPQSESQNGGR